MKRLLLSVLVAGASTALVQGQVIPGQYIAVFRDDVRNHHAVVQSLAAQHGLAVAHVYQHAIKGFAFGASDQAVAALSRRPDIAYIEQDQVMRAIEETTQTIPTGIDRADVEKAVSIDGTDDWIDVDIAVIDTGLDGNHPDLRIDPSGVRFYVSRNKILSDNNWQDDNGHGTHVGGIAAAIDNDKGVVGVAPGARLTAVKVLDKNGNGTTSTVIAGVDWVAARADKFEVANMSLGGSYSTALNSAVKNAVAKGIVFVVAAGNEGKDAGSFSPASEPTAITVSALVDTDGKPGGEGSGTDYGADDTFASFSNYGSVIDICAPGVNILSTYLGGDYATASGTSMAAPHVAGAAALYIAHNGLTKNADGVAAVAQALKDAGWKQGDPEYFSGDKDNFPEPLLNVGALLNAAPVVTITSPQDGAEFQATDVISFEGSALDDKDGDLSGALEWTSDIDGVLGTGSSVTATLSVGIHTITATATDSQGATGSASITIKVGNPNTAPVVVITTPADGAVFRKNATITFTGSASDAQDGDLSTWLVWTSSIDGQIGIGATVTAQLSEGKHTITASVVDSAGATASARITVKVGYVVVPTNFEDNEGNGWSGTVSGAVRLQEVYSKNHFASFQGPITIKGMAFRLDNSATATSGSIKIRVKLSTTSKAPDALSTTFASNVGSDVKTVFDGSVTFAATKGNWPNSFDIVIPFSTPFTYDNTKGNLLVDITTSTPAAGVYIDASNETNDGASRVFATKTNALRGTADTGADVIRFLVE